MSKISDALKKAMSALTAPADDPRVTHADAYQRQLNLLKKIQQALKDVSLAKGHLERKTIEVEQKLPRLKELAVKAMKTGDEATARTSLKRHHIANLEIKSLNLQIQEVEEEKQRLATVEQRLAAKIESFVAKQEVIVARYSAAEAQMRIKEALNEVSDELGNMGIALQFTEQKTEKMKSKAYDIDQLVEEKLDASMGSFLRSDEIDVTEEELDQLIDDQLKAMKQDLD